MTANPELQDEPVRDPSIALTPDEVGVVKLMSASESQLLYAHVLEAERADGTIHHSELGSLLILAASSAPNSYAYLDSKDINSTPLLPSKVSAFLRQAVPILVGVLLGVSALVSLGAAIIGLWLVSAVSAIIFFVILLATLVTVRRSKEVKGSED